MDDESDSRTPAAAGSTERPGATQGAAGTETIRPESPEGALGGSGGAGDYGGGGSGGSDLGGANAPKPPTQADNGRQPSSGRGATTGNVDGGVDSGPGGRTAGSDDRGA